MDDFRLTARQIGKLRELHRKQRDRRLADRLKAIVLLGSDWSVAEVAQALLVDEKSVRLGVAVVVGSVILGSAVAIHAVAASVVNRDRLLGKSGRR